MAFDDRSKQTKEHYSVGSTQGQRPQSSQPMPKPQGQDRPRPLKPQGPPIRWGLEPDLVLARLQGQEIEIIAMDGTNLIAQLVGYNQYHMTLLLDKQIIIYNKADMSRIIVKSGQVGSGS